MGFERMFVPELSGLLIMLLALLGFLARIETALPPFPSTLD